MVPGIVRILAREAEIMREDEAVLQQLAAQVWPLVVEAETPDHIKLDRRALRHQPLALQRRLLRLATARLQPLMPAPPFHLVQGILSYVATPRAGGRWQWEGLIIHCEQTALRLAHGPVESSRSTDAAQSGLECSADSLVVASLPWTGRWLATGDMISIEPVSREEGMALLDHRSPRSAVIDAERLTMPCTVRAWRPGDWFCPALMKGRRKKLQDYFTDAKLGRSQRDRVPLVVSPAGIVWVGGHRVDERFRATRESQRYLHMTLKSQR
jgi:tRNA(Ile)-lysidine synthase